MKAFCDGLFGTKSSTSSASEALIRSPTSLGSDLGSSEVNSSKTILWSNFFALSSSVCEPHKESFASEKKEVNTTCNGWTAALKRVLMASGTMRRLQERVLGPSRTGISSMTSEIWLLGVCYRISEDDFSHEATADSALAAFKHDFSSRILMTYRKGFDPIGDTKYTSDVNWGCMHRSSQMLVAQALLFHRLGRSWRKSEDKPLNHEYIEILQPFGDSEASAFSIHNLISAGESYGLAAGSWVGPYAMCRSWKSLSRQKRTQNGIEPQLLPMALHIVSGCEDGERGGAPVLCIENVSKCCLEFSEGVADWTPILLLVPLVLGLDRVNPRYIPSLQATFTFPQSLGILGGKPGASTYIIGVQEDKAFYLDPHDAQQVVNVSKENPDIETSSYHCNVLRYIPLESIDPSLALGFYCRDKDDFDDLCLRASKLADGSNGAPLFTVAQTHNTTSNENILADCGETTDDETAAVRSGCEENEDDWQLL